MKKYILLATTLGLSLTACETSQAIKADQAWPEMPSVEGSNTGVQPLSPPIPNYPIEAARRGLTGSCEVSLDVNEKGFPINIDADCTDNAFKAESENAMSKVMFPVLMVDGIATPYTGVIYPLDYRLGR
ncbi:energy transducer TonB [Hyphomonas sp. FCG-A18]|uniref:energy transducer TonB n=1 Tax=Hyphomonas sp. FCG-A18 TaxID=3080019 RepID=UPI002B290E4C|nr:energy transducer TonB [Hyphomonas sp. FCG-A18]